MAANNDKSLEKRLKLIEKNIDKLRVLYEQYFMGFEITEAVSIRKRLNRELRTLKENPPRNTALKFLLQKVTTKFKTYEQYWNRILRKIEEGTYIRQIKRMRRKVKEEGLSDEPLKGVKTKAELERALEKLNAMREKKEKSAKPSAKPSQ
jgi:fucose 4-O-acetylase-like acetyltransferase